MLWELPLSTTLEAPPSVPLPPREQPSLIRPLDALAGRIRRYVFLEAAAWLAIGVAAWMLVSLLFDWGLLFRLAGVDYLRDGLVEGHRVARVLALGLLAVGVLALIFYHGVHRGAARFNRTDLALLLERRFPGVLGDRLITTLELGDRQHAEQIDTSWPLVESTAREAEERLKQVDLNAVFNQPRLSRLGLIAGGLVAACLMFALLNADAVLTWFDRNVLLREAYWPRPILLHVENFPESRQRAVPFGNEQRVNVRAWKWVVATRENAEGWRPVEWLRDLLPGSEDQRAWELRGEVVPPRLFAALPPDWQKLTLDEVNARVEPPEAFEPYRREVGLAALTYLASQLRPGLVPDATLRNLLARDGDAPLSEAEVKSLGGKLALARRLPSAECATLLRSLNSLRPLPPDWAPPAACFACLLPLPLPPLAAVQRAVEAKNPAAPLLALTPEEAARIPLAWHAIPAKELMRTLELLVADESAEGYGDRVRLQLLALFDELDQRAEQRHWARRRTFRRLEVPAKITLEFEQLLEGEERGRVRPRRGQPEVKRQEGTLAFGYDFKKIEQPLRFRATASGTATLWYGIEVRPLPALKRLQRWHDEPGYLHSSNRRVQVGPFAMSLDGAELRGEAPAGSRVRLEGECYKPLQRVTLRADNPLDPGIGTVHHVPGAANFSLDLRPLGREDLRMQLEILDTDGIPATRQITLASLPDREPEFARTAFEVVNRKMVTSQALLPLASVLRDDHGLTSADYQVTVESMDRKALLQTRVPLRTFHPLSLARPSGGRFEKPADVKPGRVLAGDAQVHLVTLAALLRLPQAGIPLLQPPPAADATTELRMSYEDPNLFGPVLRAHAEFLDTLLVRLASGKGMDSSPWPTPYRLLVRLSAFDNRRDETTTSVPAFQEGQTPEVFDFLVVNEQDLLIEVGKREEEIRDRCEEVLANLKKLRTQVRKLHDEFDTLQPQERPRVAADAQDFSKSLASARQQADERVLREFRQIYRELALNRVQPKVLERVDGKVCVPLAQLLQTGGLFSQSGDALDLLARRLEAEADFSKGAILETLVPLDRLIQRLEEVIGEMRKLIEFNQALQALREIIKAMDANVKAIDELRKKKQKEELDP